jgi:hypothetical protein
MAYYLLVIGDREALGWVLTEQRMAFRGFKRSEIQALTPDDTLFLYTTRGCFRHPERDRGRVIAEGKVATTVARLDEPMTFRDRAYPVGCGVEFKTATVWPDGLELAPLVAEMESFGSYKEHWSVWLRRPLVALTEHDAGLLRRCLSTHQNYPLPNVLDAYAKWWRLSQSTRQV